MSDVPGLDGLLGVEHLELTADKVVVQYTIGEQHLQPFGIPHGGVYCAVHESTASTGGQIWLGEKGVVVGTNNSTDFIRQAKVGDTITTVATPIHRGRTQQLWRLETTDADGKLIAQGQVRLANLDLPVPPEALARYRAMTQE
ncbi:PaaI family thioesterase [Aeromicrobium sp. Leaf350]|uniref:PaaI family thioesterase n=1 Tax=Aeromicrobium sp. Leaf350 TaxID=2876565 RepID=UPI001E4C11FF|nr:PaaI family thioesterase [Aeromicrobium sp. Leaf350]